MRVPVDEQIIEDDRLMGIRRFLAAEGNAGAVNDIFLSEHREEKRVILRRCTGR